MSVYMVIEMAVKDEKLYAEYVAKVPAVIAKYGGTYLARSSKVVPLSGGWNPERIIIIEFESMEQIGKCFGSEEYREVGTLREQSAVGKAIAVESCSSVP